MKKNTKTIIWIIVFLVAIPALIIFLKPHTGSYVLFCWKGNKDVSPPECFIHCDGSIGYKNEFCMVSISEEKVNKIIDLISEEVQLRRGHPKPAEMDNYFVFVKKTDWWFCYYSILTPDSLKEKTKTLILDELPEDRRKTLKEVFKLMPILIPEAERRKEPFRN